MAIRRQLCSSVGRVTGWRTECFWLPVRFPYRQCVVVSLEKTLYAYFLIGPSQGRIRGRAIGPWLAKLHRKVSKIEACSPPPFASWASGFQALGSKSPDIGRKMGRNLSEDLFLLFTWFWAKNGTKFECDNFKFWSMFLSNFLKFLAPPLFKILRTLLGQAVYTRCAGPVWRKTCKQNSKRVLCKGVVKQSQTAWFTSTNEQTWLPLTG